FSLLRPPPASPLFPYTTLFRSGRRRRRRRSPGLVTETQRRIAAEAWAFRTRVEHEAADRFTRLATAISRFDAASPLPAMMQRAADRKSTRLNSSHLVISYAVFC